MLIFALPAVGHMIWQPGTERVSTARMRSLRRAIDGPSIVCVSELPKGTQRSAAGSFTVRSPRSGDIIEARRYKNV